MIRGIQLRGDVIRSLRRARGWSQLDLAARAGVGERTIRNAEMGRIIEGSTASYIAGALEVSLDMLLKLHPHPSTRFSISHFERAFHEAFLNGRAHSLQEMLHPECQWRMVGLPYRQSVIHLEPAHSIPDGFESIRATTPWNQHLDWHMNREESAILLGSFFIITIFSSLDSSSRPLRFRTHILGRLDREQCISITQTWDQESVE